MRQLRCGVMILAAAGFGGAQPAQPSFDCSKVTNAAEKLVCADENLASLDRKLSDLYTAAKKNPEQQKKWLRERDACSKSSDAKSCLQSSYERRIVELQIQSGSLKTPRLVEFACDGAANARPFTASFYNQTDPPSAVLTYGNDRVIALILRSGSGARYGAPGIEYWEHQGEAAVTWRGQKFTCKPHH